MDLSKLPRLSKTASPPGEPEPAPVPALDYAAGTMPCPFCKAPIRIGARFCDACGAQLSGRSGGALSAGPEPWAGIIIAILLMMIFPNFLKYSSSKVFHTTFAPYVDPETNQPVNYVLMTDGSKMPYPKLLDFWSDLVVTSFAIALLLEGIVLLIWLRAGPVLLTFIVSVIATVANLVYVVGSYHSGLATASIIAVVIGLYMSVYEWKLFQALRSN